VGRLVDVVPLDQDVEAVVKVATNEKRIGSSSQRALYDMTEKQKISIVGPFFINSSAES